MTARLGAGARIAARDRVSGSAGRIGGFALGASLIAGCGSTPEPMMGFDGGPLIRALSAQQLVAYEGQTRFVTVIDGDATSDLAGATITPRDAGSALVVREALCSAAACAVHLEILDLRPSIPQPIPRPIDAMNDFLVVRLADGSERHVLVTVWPLDTISNSGSPSRIGGTIFASSATSLVGGEFSGRPDGPPVRWLVTGDVRLEGDLSFGGEADVAGLGGASGGVSGASAVGDGAGGVGSGSAGGGGGGGASADGQPGIAATSGGTPGSAGARIDAACAGDFTAVQCGGGGGGGAAGEGGGGGGALLIAALGDLYVGGTVSVRGGDAPPGAGGGGGGGVVVLAGASVEIADATIELSGGEGGAPSADEAGGSGGDGVLRIDAPNLSGGGVAFDVTTADLVVDTAAYVVAGRAAPGATVEVDAVERATVQGTAIAGADGRFSIEIMLEPGLNRLRLTQSIAGDSSAQRAWNGTAFELVRVESATTPVPVGGLLDVAFVPG